MIQSALEGNPRTHPFNASMPNLSWGKIVERHTDGTFDVAIQNGSTYSHVQAGSPYLGSEVGLVYLPTHGLTNPVQTVNGTWDIPTQSTKGDLYCVVAFLENSARQPKIICFFNPSRSEMVFSTLGIYVNRLESGVYDVILPGSVHAERHFPDGSYIVVGDTTSHDMVSESPTWAPPTQSSPVPMVLHHSSGLSIEIDTTGKLTINPVNGVAIGGTEAVTLASALTTWLNGHTHTSEAAGSPTSVPITPVSGIGSTVLTTS